MANAILGDLIIKGFKKFEGSTAHRSFSRFGISGVPVSLGAAPRVITGPSAGGPRPLIPVKVMGSVWFVRVAKRWLEVSHASCSE